MFVSLHRKFRLSDFVMFMLSARQVVSYSSWLLVRWPPVRQEAIISSARGGRPSILRWCLVNARIFKL